MRTAKRIVAENMLAEEEKSAPYRRNYPQLLWRLMELKLDQSDFYLFEKLFYQVTVNNGDFQINRDFTSMARSLDNDQEAQRYEQVRTQLYGAWIAMINNSEWDSFQDAYQDIPCNLKSKPLSNENMVDLYRKFQIAMANSKTNPYLLAHGYGCMAFYYWKNGLQEELENLLPQAEPYLQLVWGANPFWKEIGIQPKPK